ncbi:hypothetical protein CBR_g38376 [Chara braunii]|uniref:Pectate lyase domain-containing protein n=1 Tax=Chara braunii TaxID=69332 RepID=A0A388JNI3_CHABU|nr:hypothetical protein CBR_g38376 [Chara braunii]|eukprot:GBG59347.1 hypothetical protein CBR_g38376 [Chara braunii]
MGETQDKEQESVPSLRKAVLQQRGDKRPVSIFKTADGALDVVRASSSVTVSHCHFGKQVKTMLVGNDDGGSEDKIQTVTLYANFFEDCVSRMPRVRYGTAHVCSNVFKHWGRYVLGASNGGHILAENNYFIPGSDNQIDHFHPPDPNDNSVISFRGNRLYGSAVRNSNEEDRFGIPFTCPALEEANIISEAGVGSWCTL